MRRSEFVRAVAAEFGTRGDLLVDDLVLTSLGSRSPNEALAAGIDTRTVWLAICEAMDVPESHRYGAGRLDPTR